MLFACRYTSGKSSSNATVVFAIVLDWPAGDLKLGAPATTSSTKVNLLGIPDWLFLANFV